MRGGTARRARQRALWRSVGEAESGPGGPGDAVEAHTGLPVGVIADRTGFKSVYHFSRRVRQATGMPPTRLRAERWAGR